MNLGYQEEEVSVSNEQTKERSDLTFEVASFSARCFSRSASIESGVRVDIGVGSYPGTRTMALSLVLLLSNVFLPKKVLDSRSREGGVIQPIRLA